MQECFASSSRAIRIDDYRQIPELGLIRIGVGDPASYEIIEHERADAHRHPAMNLYKRCVYHVVQMRLLVSVPAARA